MNAERPHFIATTFANPVSVVVTFLPFVLGMEPDPVTLQLLDRDHVKRKEMESADDLRDDDDDAGWNNTSVYWFQHHV